jgi:hypothetical protein
MLGINTAAGNVIAADFEEGAGGLSPGLNHPIQGATPIVNGVWYHAAATYDGTTAQGVGTWRLYLNGVLEAEQFVGQPVRNDSVQHAALGTMLQASGNPHATVGSRAFFDGALDEARIWSILRSADDIRNNMNVQIPSAIGLAARWSLDDNSGGTVADTSKLPGSTGTPGTIVGTGSSLETTPNSALFDVVRCADISVKRDLDLDGTDDYVLLEPLNLAGVAPTKLGLTTFTIELWFNRRGAGTPGSTGTGGLNPVIPLVTKGRNEDDGVNDPQDANYYLGIDTSGTNPVLAADFEDTAAGTNHPVRGTTPILFNTWYHAAATYSASTGVWRLYLNGAAEASPAAITPTSARTPQSNSQQPAAIGTGITSAQGNPPPIREYAAGFFDGEVDEVRIWNIARAQADIQNDSVSAS